MKNIEGPISQTMGKNRGGFDAKKVTMIPPFLVGGPKQWGKWLKKKKKKVRLPFFWGGPGFFSN